MSRIDPTAEGAFGSGNQNFGSGFFLIGPLEENFSDDGILSNELRRHCFKNVIQELV